MNSTVWHTLTGFVLYLGSSGKCKIDENEKGWHIQYIDQEEEIRRAKMQAKAKQEKSDEERMQELMQRQIERAQEKEREGGEEDGEEKEAKPKEFVKAEDEVIKFSLTSKVIAPSTVQSAEMPGPSVKPIKVVWREIFKIGGVIIFKNFSPPGLPTPTLPHTQPSVALLLTSCAKRMRPCVRNATAGTTGSPRASS